MLFLTLEEENASTIGSRMGLKWIPWLTGASTAPFQFFFQFHNSTCAPKIWPLCCSIFVMNTCKKNSFLIGEARPALCDLLSI